MSRGPTVPAPEAKARLAPGEPLAAPAWFGPDGREFPLSADRFAGRRLVLLVLGARAGRAAEAELARFSRLAPAFAEAGALALVLSPRGPADNAALTRGLGLAVPVLSDPAFSTGAALGLAGAPPGGRKARSAKPPPFATVLVDENRRVERIFGPEDGPTHARAALGACAARRPPVRVAAGRLAPVLVVPDLVDREHCARLVGFWEAGEKMRGTVSRAAGDGGAVVDTAIKRRGDVYLANDGAEARALVGLFQRRLFPEIAKAFRFRVTRAETLRIGGYDARERGHFKPHRDDTTPATRHRQFAMSLNLNTGEYRGGELRFPEYGGQVFDVARGGAVIFSCGLLHEALPVTEGRRIGVFGFFHGEADEERRRSRDPAAPEAMPVDRPDPADPR